MRSPPNVLLIIIDALRPDYLGCYGFQYDVSPHIDSVASDGVLFLNSYSPMYGTDPAVTTMLTGLYPHRHGIMRHGPWVSSTEVTLFKVRALKYWLPRVLSKLGYVTVAFDWLGRWHKSYFRYYISTAETRVEYFWRRVYRKIYMTLPYEVAKAIPGNICPYIKADKVAGKAIKMLKVLEKVRRSFFILIHFWDTHAPYDPPLKYVNMFKGRIKTPYNKRVGDVLSNIRNTKWLDYMRFCTKGAEYTDDVVARYVASIRFVDDSIGKIVTTLKELGMYDNTLVIIVSDHGESMGEHGAYFDHHTLFNEVLRNVMIMKLPNSEVRQKKVGRRVILTDLAPTILDVIGVDYRRLGRFDGESLIKNLDSDEDEDLYFGMVADGPRIDVRIGVMSGEWKYMRTLLPNFSGICSRCGVKHHDREELFNIVKDVCEENNLVHEYVEVKEKLKSRLLTEFRKHPVIKSFIEKIRW